MMYVKSISARVLVLIFFTSVFALPAWSDVTKMGVSEAHELAMRGDIELIDVRTPQEWEDTGIGASAKAVSMHLPGFLKKIKAIVHGDKTRPIALICATGRRSNRMQVFLRKHGYKNIIDVSEGMLGSTAGPGWIKSGLPLVTPG